jgi:hypothetical protein
MTQQQQQRYPPRTLLGIRTPSQLYADAAAAVEKVEETTSQKETFEFTVRLLEKHETSSTTTVCVCSHIQTILTTLPILFWTLLYA